MSAGKPLDVMVVGDLFADLVMSGFASWPTPGEELFAKRFCREIGGGAAITASGLAKLGAKVAVVGVVGETDGQWLIERLETNGVNTSAIQRSSREPTAVAVSISSATDRTFLTYMGANRELPAILKPVVSRREFAKARHVHLAFAPEPAEAGNLFTDLTAQGCSLSVDVGWHPEWLSNADCREALRFDGGFLFAWLRGDDPQNCLKAGTVCGALSTRRLGGIAGFPTVAEMDALI
jgi:sugar/nucleoside kinase (ribokinase family)